MPGFRTFEEIEAWQTARQLVRAVYEASGGNAFARDFGLRDQIRRGAVSIMANIAEGFGRGGNREFVQFLAVAKGSTHEVISHLYVALDQGYVSQAQFDALSAQARQVGRITGGLMEYLRKSPLKGPRHRPEEEPAPSGEPPQAPAHRGP